MVLLHARAPRTRETEEVLLLEARGRVLAGELVADRDQPPFDRVTRDGFAVRFEDWNAGLPLRTIGLVRAGEFWTGARLRAGEAIEIMTGAPLPPGADAVCMLEHIERTALTIQPVSGRKLGKHDNVVLRGIEARAADVLLQPCTSIGAAEIALAAACGRARLTTFRKPCVAILATGDELVELEVEPQPQQIRNSNSFGIAALVEAAGGAATRLPIARDDRQELLRLISEGRRADLLVLSGGVSMGQYDLVEETLALLGAEFFFTGVTMQPGKPIVFGCLPPTSEYPSTFFFGLPGNPVSTQVTFQVFVAPLLRALGGREASGPGFVLATLEGSIAGKPGLTRLLPGRLTGTAVRLVGWQGSGDLAANARANCYVLLPEDRPQFAAGEIVRVLLQ